MLNGRLQHLFVYGYLRHSTNVILMLVHRLRHWHNIKTILVDHLMFADLIYAYHSESCDHAGKTVK